MYGGKLEDLHVGIEGIKVGNVLAITFWLEKKAWVLMGGLV